MTGRRLQQETFRAMGTVCTVAVTAGPFDATSAQRALAAGCKEVVACEHVLSRFDPKSDLCRLNAADGDWTEVDERLMTALHLALRARDETDGRFDPTILPALVAAGYDRSFEQLDARPATNAAGWRAGAAVELDRPSGRARAAQGAAIDLGGIGKGFAAARALEAMREAWPLLPGGLVDLGGDIAVWGSTPEGGPWRLAIADPRTPESTLGTLELEVGGVATSGRDCRRFGPDGTLHHLIDPATGAPARLGTLAVTVVAPSSVEAEVHATALAVTDPGDVDAYLEARPHLAALLVPDEGEPVVLGGLPLAKEECYLVVGP